MHWLAKTERMVFNGATKAEHVDTRELGELNAQTTGVTSAPSASNPLSTKPILPPSSNEHSPRC
jgi:hypothetical protein